MEERKQSDQAVGKPRAAYRKRHWGIVVFALVNVLTGLYLIASLGFMVTADGIIGHNSDGKIMGAFFIAMLWWFIAYFSGRSHRLPPLLGLLCAQAMPLFVFLPGFLKLVGYWALSPWLPIYSLLPFKSSAAVVLCLILNSLITVLLWFYASYWRKGARVARKKAAAGQVTASAAPAETSMDVPENTENTN